MTKLNYDCTAKEITNFMQKEIKEHDLRKAIMSGVYEDLKKIKKQMEELYEDNFYLDYWESECAYHGWKWSEDDGTMSSMAYICDEILKRIKEIYGLALIGTGETECESDVKKAKVWITEENGIRCVECGKFVPFSDMTCVHEIEVIIEEDGTETQKEGKAHYVRPNHCPYCNCSYF